ncbi:hypothetical protein NP493_4322g00007 [Ridgeia piscesae]|uniref:Uncharacterized protein n=1 Tax=Ridgeia piscesae TaxID=27915 RepID=A0AAD9IZW9_RIDPI|nr:hypothetical protein NP493_4322g00006 [Ridgeia piscesae]KAK2143692.1 hypothetical protein NP493_4322g00007 [Ridgeia piscesae]
MQQGQRLLPVMPMQRPQPWKVLQVKRMSLV